MAPVELKSFELPLDCEDFLHKFWFNIAFFERFLIEKLLDVGVEIEAWKQSGDHPINRSRTVRSLHPSKISFPGLPSHAEVITFLNMILNCRGFIYFNAFVLVYQSPNYRMSKCARTAN